MTLGNIGSETINAFKSSPLLLLVVVLNAGMIFALMYVGSSQREERQMLTRILVENCKKS